MFPNPPAGSDDSDAETEHAASLFEIASRRGALEESWSTKLRKALPNLTEIHLAESQEETLGVGGFDYIGTRTVWYRTRADWRKTEWGWPGERRMPADWSHGLRRTTRKANFDAWSSDGEYSELEESGW